MVCSSESDLLSEERYQRLHALLSECSTQQGQTRHYCDELCRGLTDLTDKVVTLSTRIAELEDLLTTLMQEEEDE